MTPRDSVLNFFANNAKNPLPASAEDVLACYYLDAEIIDSLGIVMMIAELEDTLKIAFSSEDMQSYEFQTIGELISIVERLVADKK